MKSGLIGLVVGLVAVGATYLLCANAHLDIFPCKRVHKDHSYMHAPLVEQRRTCSLLNHNRGKNHLGEYDELTPGGWAALAAFCLGAGVLAGLGASRVVRAAARVS